MLLERAVEVLRTKGGRRLMSAWPGRRTLPAAPAEIPARGGEGDSTTYA